MASIRQHISFGAQDWGCMALLFFDNASTLLGTLTAIFNMTFFGVPLGIINKVVYTKLVPGVGLLLCCSNLYNGWVGVRLSRIEGRTFVAQPSGIDTAAAFSFIYQIFYTVYSSSSGTATERFLKGYHVALASNFVSGMIMVALALVGPKLIKVIPSSALVVPVAGMCFAFLGLEQASTPLGAPLVGFMTIMTMFLGWFTHIRVSVYGFKIPEALQVIIVGIIFGWATGLNKKSAVYDAAELVTWHGPSWVGGEIFESFTDVRDFIGLIFPLVVSSFGTSMMVLIANKKGGDEFPVTESIMAVGVSTIIGSLFGSPFGVTLYFGQDAYKKSGATCGYSFLNGSLYLITAWLGLIALIRSVVNQQTVGPIVLFIGLAVIQECIRCLPPRHYVAFVLGLFPSISEWAANVSARESMIRTAVDGMEYNANLPKLTEGWWGVLGFKNGAILVSMCWTAILVSMLDRKWSQAAIWGGVSAAFAACGMIHAPIAGFTNFAETRSDLCVPVTDDEGVVITADCWKHADQWQYMTAYLMLSVVFLTLEGLRSAGIGDLKDPIEEVEVDDKGSHEPEAVKEEGLESGTQDGSEKHAMPTVDVRGAK